MIFTSFVFAAFFSLFVFTIESYWTWSRSSWVYKLGADDFAGGNWVNTSGGYSALVISWFLVKRKDFEHDSKLTCRQRKRVTTLWFSLRYFSSNSAGCSSVLVPQRTILFVQVEPL